MTPENLKQKDGIESKCHAKELESKQGIESGRDTGEPETKGRA